MKNLQHLLISSLLLLTLGSMTNLPQDKATGNELIGTWKWIHVTNSETQQILGLDILTMGLAKEIKTEFKQDSTYVEYKNKLKGEGYAMINGLWGIISETKTLKMKAKDQWISSKIIYLTKDTLIIEIRKPMHLLMIKEK
ncbi:MAG: hypothetical protein WCI53_10690 [Bacteroidota bacterium]|jgi:hypothetical protein